MFLKNLSTAILHICEENNLTYEAASERCGLSLRFFSDIVRGNTTPSVRSLEKLCVGLGCTPNELLTGAPIHHKVPKETEPGVCPCCGTQLAEAQRSCCKDRF